MLKKRCIRRFVAGLMLVIFAISITPTIFLHNWLANHKDSVGKLPAGNYQQVGKTRIKCNCDNIVAESPFTQPDNSFQLPQVQPFSIRQGTKLIHFISSKYFHFSLRGPPLV